MINNTLLVKNKYIPNNWIEVSTMMPKHVANNIIQYTNYICVVC